MLDLLLPVLVAKKVNAEGTIVNKNEHSCVFVNFKSECSKWAGVLKEKLADKLIDVHVIQIHGDQDKHETFAFTQLFTSSVKMQNYNPFMLFTTAAASTGIDQTLVEWVMTVGLPRCLTTLLQECGRNRSEGLYLIVTDWKLFIKLLLTILVPLPKQSQTEELPDYEYMNTMIATKTPEKHADARPFQSQVRKVDFGRCPIMAYLLFVFFFVCGGRGGSVMSSESSVKLGDGSNRERIVGVAILIGFEVAAAMAVTAQDTRRAGNAIVLLHFLTGDEAPLVEVLQGEAGCLSPDLGTEITLPFAAS
mmetsp:Transcript_13120/g.28340  ORF Transcript_13120/g.28340 Transcript_13120/m.28340 type:complete len:306 (-) Transcript_13120:172-1089(-)